jgi:hypothetical protein
VEGVVWRRLRGGAGACVFMEYAPVLGKQHGLGASGCASFGGRY